ncbi:MlaA family lipoprotein [Magnetococcus sp. PR-3]|uniref:MlaA family lipoprotein n=1 Tax=Magnetococcus sp. PR-3 TaxID=3120355 RepID=UPI002FCE3B54
MSTYMGWLKIAVVALALVLAPQAAQAQEQLALMDDAIWAEFDENNADLWSQGDAINDPLEGWNRAMFAFNDKLYFWLLKPISTGYAAIIPQGGRQAVRNFFSNLKEPVHIVNSLLQGKVKQAGVELTRFSVNSTVGVLGLFDIAGEHHNLVSHKDDLGQTFGSYGAGEGLYIVWPILGASTVRDSVGLVGDAFLTPTTYLEHTWAQIGVRGLETVNRTSLSLGDYESIKSAAIDPYIAVRNGFKQIRDREIQR